MENKPLEVVVGIVLNPEGKVLIAEREFSNKIGGNWEFPGGKVEHDETYLQALIREFKEEIGITIKTAYPLQNVSYSNDGCVIKLYFWLVTAFANTAFGREGQRIKWIDIAALNDHAFPHANQPIIDRILQLKTADALVAYGQSSLND